MPAFDPSEPPHRYEMLGTPQRDFTPEMSAEALASLPETHYSMT